MAKIRSARIKTFSYLKLDKLVDDVEQAWYDTPVIAQQNTGQIPRYAKTRLIRKWSDESKIPVSELNSLSEDLIKSLTWLVRLRSREQIYSGLGKFYYKLKFRKLSSEYLNFIYLSHVMNAKMR